MAEEKERERERERETKGGNGKGRCGKRAEIGGGLREGEPRGRGGLGSTLEHINCRATGYIETGWGRRHWRKLNGKRNCSRERESRGKEKGLI